MKKHFRKNMALNTLGILLLCNWGNNDEENVGIAGGKKPDVDFYGTIKDNTESVVDVQYITIAGLYRQIPVYCVPQDLTKQDYNPTSNVARLDLSEIQKILVEQEKIIVFGGKNYIAITVVSNDGVTKNNYLLESGKKVYCDQMNNSGPIEREIALTAIKEVVINGYRETPKVDNPKNSDLSNKKDIKCAYQQTKQSMKSEQNRLKEYIKLSYNKGKTALHSMCVQAGFVS